MTVQPVRKRRPKPPKIGSFIQDGDTYIYKPDSKLIRFMFDDGTTIDVLAPRDDSDVREGILNVLGKEKIVGVAYPPIP